ncbi:MAG: FprA family A-type flavoprotein [Deltaproteobacteria bacterium]|nr:FprA family A-type flavoprotein [Deltaproteobacteria bacterium]MBK8235045.1 FprA family A-type flavoprotein [Deltaproteobacteria bacterium]MBP7290179.1 FprA family A-type flavoprotein [Nannocystaceae bacterium]
MSDNKPLTLFSAGEHRNFLLPDFETGTLAVQANQHLIVHGSAGMLLDPGGHKVYAKVLSETFALLGRSTLTTILLSHQDPDIVAAINGWLTTTDAVAYTSVLWARFIPHFGLDQLLGKRLLPVPDEGMWIDLGGSPLALLPAHFLHSCGNLHVYDPTSKILYSGDLGASLGQPYREVEDFDAHLQYMDGFHRRYMGSNSMMRAWGRMVRSLDIELIAPQHGALFRGREMVERFIGWCEGLECGIDVMASKLAVPPRP